MSKFPFAAWTVMPATTDGHTQHTPLYNCEEGVRFSNDRSCVAKRSPSGQSDKRQHGSRVLALSSLQPYQTDLVETKSLRMLQQVAHRCSTISGNKTMTSHTANRPFDGVRTVITTSVGFDEVLERLRAQMGRGSVQEIVALAKTHITEAEYIRNVQERFVGESGFILFTEIDHGGWLPKFGINRRSVRWILGNPLIAVTMIQHDITAGLFAPVELLVTEAENGHGATVTYVRPSTLMVIEENQPLLGAAMTLDAKYDALVAWATTP
jgi:uncharacterized protein (DUF302 family)